MWFKAELRRGGAAILEGEPAKNLMFRGLFVCSSNGIWPLSILKIVSRDFHVFTKLRKGFYISVEDFGEVLLMLADGAHKGKLLVSDLEPSSDSSFSGWNSTGFRRRYYRGLRIL